ncbi:MAG: helix-turn-helix domain-containing protein [Lepagella sp.]
MDSTDKSSVSLAVSAMGNMAYIYSVHEFGKSFNYLNKAIKLAEKYKIEEKLPFLYLNMANLLRANETIRTPDHISQSTIGYYTKCYDASIKEKDWKTALLAFDNVVHISIGCNQISDVRSLLDKYKDLNGLPSNTPHLDFTRLHYEVARAVEVRDFTQAISLLEEMEKLTDSIDNIRMLLMVLSDKVSIFYQTGQYGKCIKESKRAIELAENNDERDVAVSFYKMLSDCYLSINDKTNYRHYYMNYLLQKDSLYYQNKLLDVEYLKFSSELEDVNSRMQILSLEKRNHQIIANFAIIIALMILVVLIITTINYRRIRKQKRELFDRYQSMIEDQEAKNRLMIQYEQDLSRLKEELEGRHTNDVVSSEDSNSDTSDSLKYKYNHIDEDMKDVIMARILKVMDQKEEICKDSFSVQRLSELIGWKYNYVAQVIGERFHKNFNQLVADYRVKEACRMLQNPQEYGNMTIEAIGQEVGYKSRTSFCNIFKRVTGLSPSAFAAIAKEKSKESAS